MNRGNHHHNQNHQQNVRHQNAHHSPNVQQNHHGLHTAQNILHIIRPNDTFWELAKFYDTSIDSMIALNPSVNPRNLQIGTSVLITPGPNFVPTNTINQTDTTDNLFPSFVTHPNTADQTGTAQDNLFPDFVTHPNTVDQVAQNDLNQPNQVITSRVHPMTRPSSDPVKPNRTWSIFTPNQTGTNAVRPINTPTQNNTQLIQVPTAPTQPISPTHPMPIPAAIVQHCNNSSLCGIMRLCWSQNIYWSRMLLLSIMDRTATQNSTTQRLMQNPNEIGLIFAKYYGNAVGQRVAQLMHEGLTIMGDLFTAMRDRRNSEIDRLNSMLNQNATNFAEYLGQISQNFNSNTANEMTKNFNDLTARQGLQQSLGNASASIQTFNQLELLALDMADYLSNGIIDEHRSPTDNSNLPR